LAENDGKIQHLSDTIESRDQDIEFLKAVVGQLSERVDGLEGLIKTHFAALGGDVEHLADELTGTNRHMSEIQGTVDGLQTRVLERAGSDTDASIVDLASHTFKCIGTFVGHQGPVWALAVHGDMLFSGSSDETIKVWDTRTSSTFRVKQTLEGHRGIVHALATYDHVLYSGSHDCTIKVWSIENDFELQETLTGHENPVCCLAVANGTLFSGSLKVVNIWDLDTLQLIGSMDAFNHWVRALVVSSPDSGSTSWAVFLVAGLASSTAPRLHSPDDPNMLPRTAVLAGNPSVHVRRVVPGSVCVVIGPEQNRPH
jgi:E3 ubiquitin-protein ligase TRAF7